MTRHNARQRSNSADGAYTPTEAQNVTRTEAPQCSCRGRGRSVAANVPRQTRQVNRGLTPAPPTVEYIDIDLGDNSDEDSHSSHSDNSPAAPPNPPIATASSAGDAPIVRPVITPGSQGSNARVANDINHFFQRGRKNNPQTSTVCLCCEQAQDRPYLYD
ncbi:hypothetical protein PILCRDRAFT_14172 [Piloderma croceum F 1598]|uniref:Uncharacterized protein n=1 Tax=Piloderma croceum (strain F 1598) TaxID=765440 RepID=A0A0C3F3X3_PILCF|nr:hypothetical protein PILCRDRAFT_14172 [Piloderma croceum F 1598]